MVVDILLADVGSLLTAVICRQHAEYSTPPVYHDFISIRTQQKQRCRLSLYKYNTWQYIVQLSPYTKSSISGARVTPRAPKDVTCSAVCFRENPSSGHVLG